jgi:integrase
MLTDLDCRTATCPPEKKRHRLADSGGLYLEVGPNGSRRWFVKYRHAGKEKRLALGSYPGVTLKAARAGRDAARAARAVGLDPVQDRRATKAANRVASAQTFEAVAREVAQAKASGWSDTYATRWLERLEKDLFPFVGAQPLRDLGAPVLLDALRRVERRGAIETAHKLRQSAGQVFRFGIQTGRCDRNPAQDLTGALKPLLATHMAAVLEPTQAGGLMKAITGYSGQPVTRAALLISALTFQRPGNIRQMEWAEVSGDLWTIPAAKMKRTLHGKVNGRPHLVPLSAQALAALDEIRPLTGHGRFVFPSIKGGEQCLSENTVRLALRRMGFDATAHGFRAMARTLIVEHLPGVSPDVIEAQLAHAKSGPLGMAYDRAEFVQQRRELMQRWADYLDELTALATTE